MYYRCSNPRVRKFANIALRRYKRAFCEWHCATPESDYHEYMKVDRKTMRDELMDLARTHGLSIIVREVVERRLGYYVEPAIDISKEFALVKICE